MTKIFKEKLQQLTFDDCVNLLENIEYNLELDDLIYSRMAELDEKRFIEFANNYY